MSFTPLNGIDTVKMNPPPGDAVENAALPRKKKKGPKPLFHAIPTKNAKIVDQ